MSAPRDDKPLGIWPYGCCIQHSNNPHEPRWLVMRWGEILQVCLTLDGAYLWLKEEMGAD